MSKKPKLIDTLSADELSKIYADFDEKELKKIFKKEGKNIFDED